MACMCPVTLFWDCHLCYDCSKIPCPYGFKPTAKDKKWVSEHKGYKGEK